MTVLMNCTCAAPVAVVGPTCSHVALISSHAFLAPLYAASKYGLLMDFGMTAIFSPFLIAPLDEPLDPDVDGVLLELLEQAAVLSRIVTTQAVIPRSLLVRMALLL